MNEAVQDNYMFYGVYVPDIIAYSQVYLLSISFSSSLYSIIDHTLPMQYSVY